MELQNLFGSQDSVTVITLYGKLIFSYYTPSPESSSNCKAHVIFAIVVILLKENIDCNCESDCRDSLGVSQSPLSTELLLKSISILFFTFHTVSYIVTREIQRAFPDRDNVIHNTIFIQNFIHFLQCSPAGGHWPLTPERVQRNLQHISLKKLHIF